MKCHPLLMGERTGMNDKPFHSLIKGYSSIYNRKEVAVYMNDAKTIELQRKRNAKLQEELDRLKEQNLNDNKDSENRKVSDMVPELEDIRKEWLEIQEELNRERREYRGLIEDLRSIREIFRMI